MNSRTHISDELRELNSSLPANANEPVFTVPEGYFDHFAASVLAKIKDTQADAVNEELSTLSPLLAAIPKKMPYSTPENYFNELATGLPSLMAEEVLPSVLDEHHRQMPYETPAGYFESLPQVMLARVAKPTAKVIRMRPQRWMRVAAAAMVAGIIAISGFFYFNGANSVDPQQNPDEWVANKLKGVSNDVLEDFIQTTDVSPNGTQTASGTAKSAEVRTMLGDVSDGELENFLEQVPTDDEELYIIN
jgi:hypothetical protein